MFLKRFSALIIALVTVFALSSCQLSEYIDEDKAGDTAADTAASSDKVNTSTNPADYIPEGVDVSYTMDYMSEDLTAYITLGEYKNIAVEVKTYEVNDEYVSSEIEKLLAGGAKPEQITDRKTAEGDTICVDYTGTLDGVAFAGGSAKDVIVTLSENNGYIPGFVDGMYDVMPGETVSYAVTFPEVYQNNPDLAGKETVFTVTVHYIEGEDIIPELNDEYVKENFGSEGCETVEDFMVYYRSYLEDQRKAKVKEDASLAAWNIIKENTTVIEVPEKAVEALYWQGRSNAEAYAAGYGMSYEDFLEANGTNDDEQVAYARDYITEDLIIFSILKAEDMDLTAEQYAEDLAAYALEHGISEEYLTSNYSEEQIKNVFRWNRLMDAVYEWSSVTETLE